MNACAWLPIWLPETEHGIIVQDTAWDGYEEIPAWIMQGYGTMVMEADAQLHEDGCEAPDSCIYPGWCRIPCRCCSGIFCEPLSQRPRRKWSLWKPNLLPVFTKVLLPETEAIRIVDGDMATIMAGLACGEPNTISWDILKNHVDTFVAAPDWVAAKGMRMLAAPIKGDTPVTSGESGAAPFGTLACIMMHGRVSRN